MDQFFAPANPPKLLYDCRGQFLTVITSSEINNA
jgi:hypothetical protein